MVKRKKSVKQHEKEFIHVRKKFIGTTLLSLLCLLGVGASGFTVWFMVALQMKASGAGVHIFNDAIDQLFIMIPMIVFITIGIGMVFLTITTFLWGFSDKGFWEMLEDS